MESTVNEFAERIYKLQANIDQQNWHAMIITQHVDLYYLTGSMQAGVLWVPVAGEAVFYVRKSVARAKEEAICRVEPIQAIRPTWGQWRKEQSKRPIIGVTYDTITMQQMMRLQGWMGETDWQDATGIMRTLRSVKSAFEIEQIRANAILLDQVFSEVIPTIQVGMTDLSILAKLEAGLRAKGHTGLLRVRATNSEIVTGTVGSGAAIAMPSSFDGPAGGEGLHPSFPKGAGLHQWQVGEPLLVDIGCSLNGYVIDQTRTIVCGQMSEALEKAYLVSEKILHHTESKLRAGAIPSILYEEALQIAASEGLENHFMGYAADQAKFLGHGIGLEIDEWPVLAKGFDEPLQVGMVIAIEPKFTFPGQGVVGIEDTYLITDQGFERVTVTVQKLFRTTNIGQN